METIIEISQEMAKALREDVREINLMANQIAQLQAMLQTRKTSCERYVNALIGNSEGSWVLDAEMPKIILKSPGYSGEDLEKQKSLALGGN